MGTAELLPSEACLSIGDGGGGGKARWCLFIYRGEQAGADLLLMRERHTHSRDDGSIRAVRSNGSGSHRSMCEGGYRGRMPSGENGFNVSLNFHNNFKYLFI